MSIYATMANSVLQQLKKRNMEGYYCETRQEAADLACSLVPPGASVSWGGSATLGQLGILDRIFDDATVFKLRGESFRGKKLETVSLQTGKVPAVETVVTKE